MFDLNDITTPKEQTVNRCKTCVFWNEVSVLRGGQKGTGECRRFPPTPYPMPNQGGVMIMNVYPNTNENEKACGEYKEAEGQILNVVNTLGPRL